MVARTQTSAAGVLALLSEPEPIVKQHALQALIPLVPQFWAEISEHVALIESLYESKELQKEARDSAALLASKVYYFLGEHDEALSFALGAGPAFEAESRVPGSEEYIETVVSKAIDRYVELRSDEASAKKIDLRLQDIVEGIFKRCIEDGEHKQAIGIALESHRLDLVLHIYKLTRDVSLLSYAMDSVIDMNFSLSYRNEVLNFLLPLFPPLEAKASHVYAVTRILVTLSSPSLTIPILTKLVPNEKLLAYQLAFDLVEGGGQDFLVAIRAGLPDDDSDTKEIYDTLRQILTGQESVKLYLQFLRRNNKVDMLILKNTKDVLEPRSSVYHNALTLQNAYMHAGTTSDVFLRENLEWLGKATNWAKFSATVGLGVIHKGHFEEGMNILGPYLPVEGGNQTPGIQGAQYSEGGALYALGIVNAGCGIARDVESYLRDKLRAATNEVVQHGAALGLGIAGMGGKNEQSYDDLKQALYTDSAVAGEAAGYAMGLVMLGTADARCADEMLAYARETQHEKIIRGLAIGLAFLYYGRQEQADDMIKMLLAEKDPILRYGGVYTVALAYAGTSNNDAMRKLLHVAVSDTSDDVRRAAVTSLAFVLFKNPSSVPRIVQLLSESYNPHVRCGATLALGIACAGTGLQDAVDILEPMTRDPVDFVRQGAFIALGMILVEQSEAASPSMSTTRSLYAKIVGDKHEDPMARFGAALGQGLIDASGRNATISLQSRAGSRNTSAIVGMVLFCQFWYWFPLAHCACLAFEPTAIIGLNEELKAPKFEFISNAKPSLFAYPPLTKSPTKEPVTKVTTAVLSTTAKAKARERTKEKEKAAATAKADAMETDSKVEFKPEAKGDVEMKTEDTPPTTAETSVDVPPTGRPESDSSASDGQKGDGNSLETKKRKSEPSSERLPNFSRVIPAQLAHIVFPPEGRFLPVRPVSTRSPKSAKGKSFLLSSAKTPMTAALGVPSERYAGGGGILILIDQAPGESVEFIEEEIPPPPPPPADSATTATGAPVPAASQPTGPHIALDENAPEAEPPASFEYPFDD
ncbi:RPN2 [Sanghuangporus weigelae]